MRKCSAFALAYLLLASLTMQAQQQRNRLSPLTYMYLQDLQKTVVNDAPPGGYVYKRHANGGLYICGLIKVNNNSEADAKLQSIGAVVGTKAGNIWTVQVPYNKVQAMANITGISYIQLDEPLKPTLDIARKTTRVDSVHMGYNMPFVFTGAEVVVGIIDFGFDYTHPTFFDTNYNNYRIKKVWEMNGTGTPPANYTYGRELVGDAAIQAAGTDNSKQTHGTGVAGMAAGSGYGSLNNSKLRGMAFNADLVFVGVRRDSIGGQWMSSGFSDFIDGIKYIFDYATAVNRPAVVNISWGSQSGPHDGSSLMNQACDNMTGAGRIIVMSAGNEGQEKLHLSKTFTAADSLVSTFPTFTSNAYKRTWVDIWGETGKTFCAKVTMYKNGIAGNTSGYICLDDATHSLYLKGGSGLDTCFLRFITSTAEFNGKPRMTIDVYDRTADSFCVTVKATDGTVNMWDEYYYYGYTYQYASDFESCNQSFAVNGNTSTTVSDMGAAQSVMLVGAYVSKIGWRDLTGNIWTYSSENTNRIASFSSIGPMIDGRIKPDITAPGLTVATSMSSFDADYLPGGKNQQQLVASFVSPANGKTYYFGEFSGTSAASPAAAGIVALMLQANPRLTPQQTKDIIRQTAITDTYTGTVPNNTWGNGKINAYGAVKMALQQNGVYNFKGRKLDCALFPNPNNGKFTLEYTGIKTEQLEVKITSILGAVVNGYTWKVNGGSNLREFDCAALPKGVYTLNIISTDGSVAIKTVLQ